MHGSARRKLTPRTMTETGKKLAVEFVGKGMKSHFAARLAGISENELAEALEDEAIFLRQAERYYDEYVRPQTEKNVQDFLDEFPQEEKRNIRMKLLLERMRKAKAEKDTSNLSSLLAEYQILRGLMLDITAQQVIQARNHPITNFIKSSRGMAKCPFHPDKSPSMDIRKNFYHCYGCGAQGDVIDLAMKLENLTFKQAIERLS